MICWAKEKQMEGSFGWEWVVDLKFVLHSLKPTNTDIKYFLLKVEISNPGVLKESIAKVFNHNPCNGHISAKFTEWYQSSG